MSPDASSVGSASADALEDVPAATRRFCGGEGCGSPSGIIGVEQQSSPQTPAPTGRCCCIVGPPQGGVARAVDLLAYRSHPSSSGGVTSCAAVPLARRNRSLTVTVTPLARPTHTSYGPNCASQSTIREQVLNCMSHLCDKKQ